MIRSDVLFKVFCLYIMASLAVAFAFWLIDVFGV